MYVEEYRTKWSLAQLEELLKFSEKKKLDIHEMKFFLCWSNELRTIYSMVTESLLGGIGIISYADNINSIANYLAHYKKVTGSLDKSVLRYNPSSMYQKAVLALAEDAERIIN